MGLRHRRRLGETESPPPTKIWTLTPEGRVGPSSPPLTQVEPPQEPEDVTHSLLPLSPNTLPGPDPRALLPSRTLRSGSTQKYHARRPVLRGPSTTDGPTLEPVDTGPMRLRIRSHSRGPYPSTSTPGTPDTGITTPSGPEVLVDGV